MKKRLFAALSAAALCLTALPLNASAVVVMPTAPASAPTDLTSAVQFHNTYGAVHIEDGRLCIVNSYFAGYRCFLSQIS